MNESAKLGFDEYTSIKIPTIYFIFSALWILLSDQILFYMVKEPAIMTYIQMIKGWLFILTTTFIIFILLRRDIGKYLAAQAALRKSEKQYRLLIETMSDGMMMIDTNGLMTYLNDQACEILGRKRDEILGRQIFSFMDEANQRIIKKELEKRKKGYQGSYELTFIRKDGSTVPTLLSPKPIFNENGHFEGSFAVIKDFTGIKQAEQSLRESENRYRTLFESANDAIVILQGNACIECNQKTLEMFGLTRDQFIGHLPHEFSPPYQPDGRESNEKALEKITKVLDGKSQVFEWRHLRRNGDVFDAEVSLNLIEIESEKYIQAIFRDVSARKKMGEELQLMQRWIEVSVDLFFWVGEDSRILYVNQAVCHALGYTKEDFNTMKVGDFDLDLPLEDWPDFTQKVRAMGSYCFETRFGKKNGQVFHVEITANTINYEGKAHFFAYGRDISVRKRDLKLQEAQLRLIDYAANHSAGELLQKFLDEAEELTESKIGFYHFVEPDQKTLTLQAWSTSTLKICMAEGPGLHYSIEKAGVWVDCVREGKPVIHNDYEGLAHKKGLPKGHVAVIRQLVVPILRKGMIVAILGVGNKESDYSDHDVEMLQQLADFAWETIERKRAEQAIQTSEEKYRFLIENIPSVVWKSSEHGETIFISPNVETIYGYSQNEIYANAESLWFGKIHPADQESVKRSFDMLIEQNKPFDVQYRIQKKNGEWIWIHDVAMSAFEEDGTRYAQGVFTDITDRKNLESQLRQTQKMEAMGTLAGGIAHDFNNILSSVIGYSEIALDDDLSPDAPARSSLENVLKAGYRAKALVKQILAFSRQTQYEKKPISLKPIVKEVLKLMRASLPSNIEIRQDILTDTIKVLGDPTQILQVLMNLCTNAGYAMRESGGILEVALSTIEYNHDDPQRPKDLKPGSCARLSVADTGPGMTPSVVEQIFNPFFSTKPKEEGTGLGLAVVHGIVAEHGGAINVDSEPGKGTTFWVYLPLLADSKGIDETTAMDLPSGNERILVVDDEKVIAQLTEKTLERLGYTVTAVSSSQKALDMFSDDPSSYDLVITDQTMPGITGDQLALKILAIRADIPIILCTGFSHVIDEAKAKAMRIQEFIMKPIVGSELAVAVRRVLDRNGG